MAKVQEISSQIERARCESIPALAAFVDAIEPSVEADPEAFWGCSEALATLTRSNFLADLLTWELECLRRDPDYIPCPRGARDFAVLQLGLLTLGVLVFDADPEPPSPLLFGFCEHNISTNIGPGPVLVERWRQAWDGPPEIFDRSRSLIALAPVHLRVGETFTCRAHSDVVRMRGVDAATVVISLTRLQATRLRWVYDAATLLPVRAEAADLRAARIDYAMTLLSALGHTAAAPVIATLLDHPDHFVRWSAVRRVMELDPALGEPLVHRALTDPHPHVQRAAQRSLERLNALRLSPVIQETVSHGRHA
jgi:hypothetical protein